MGAEWPLVGFTLLVQTAAGLLIVSQLLALSGDGVRMRGADIAALIFGAAGLAVSFAHLGMPLHSPYALFNIGSSWLSREIFCTSAFIGCLVVLVVSRRVPALHGFAVPFAGLAFVAALACLFAMSMVYLIVTVPAWNTPATVLNFVSTALLLGTLAAGLFVAARPDAPAPLDRSAGLLLALLALAVLGKAIELPMSLFNGLQENARGVSGLSAVLADGAWLYLVRVALLVIGVVLSAWAGARALRGATAAFAVLGSCAFIVVLAGEVIGRFGFFEMHVLNGL